ncbi:kinase-like domain-containing protein [Hypoxylon crocopeplum]|nr:kinase-like domain-containing protein [Hypoxylon crocopeplum]
MESQSVNDSAFNRALTLCTYKFLTHVRGRFNRSGSVKYVSKYCIKSTKFTTLAEANTIQFISRNTSIPVPDIYCAFEHAGRTYIVMEKIIGQNLWYGWFQRSEASKRRILEQLRAIAVQLHGLKPPQDIGVANVNGGPIYDQRLPNKSCWGPFKSIQDFHRELRNGVETEHLRDQQFAAELRELISFHNQPWPTSVFTHGDLSSLNIIARGDEIVGIVDWETAGWMPPYWEYTSAWNVNPQNRFWQEEVDKFLTPMPHELEMEKIRLKYFGDF